MIVTEKRPFEELQAELKDGNKISIVSCSVCASICKTGGLMAIREIKQHLEDAGRTVLEDYALLPVCTRNLGQKLNTPEGESVLVLACDAGMINVEKHLPDKQIVSGTHTLGLGAFNEAGKITIVREFK